jgi:hypothetical protein
LLVDVEGFLSLPCSCVLLGVKLAGDRALGVSTSSPSWASIEVPLPEEWPLVGSDERLNRFSITSFDIVMDFRRLPWNEWPARDNFGGWG